MYDVILVGSGVAGCHTASLLPEDLDIMLLEKHKKVRPKDSGLVSRKFLSFINEPRLIREEIKEIECTSPSGKKFFLNEKEPFLYLLKREMFSNYLRKHAKKKGEMKFEAAIDVIHRKDCVTVRTANGEYDAKMVIGCDGANSMVRKSMGIGNPALSVGVMVKTLEKMSGKIQVFFNKYYSPDYFSWVIPQNREYGLITAIRPNEYIRHFAKKQALPGGRMYAYLMPMGTTKSYGNRALLVGDSCGQSKPLTGGGIVFSQTASTIAAEIVKDAFEANKFNSTFLCNYERLWKMRMHREIWRQLMVRKIYRNLSNKEIDALFDDFGGYIQALTGFDYDKFSMSWRNLPKAKLMKFVLMKARYAF